jgi:hypothetical protein
MQSRSGSSMVAGIFAAHGFWVGESYDGTGYRTFENWQVKATISENKERLTRGEFVDAFDIGFEPDREPWIWKGPVEFYPCFADLEHIPVLVRRDLEANTQAVLARHPGGDYEYARDLAARRNELMDEIDGIDVYTDRLISGDLSSIRNAIEACDIEFDPDLAASVIRPEMWHWRSS